MWFALLPHHDALKSEPFWLIVDSFNYKSGGAYWEFRSADVSNGRWSDCRMASGYPQDAQSASK